MFSSKPKSSSFPGEPAGSAAEKSELSTSIDENENIEVPDSRHGKVENDQAVETIYDEPREYLTGVPRFFLVIGLCIATFAFGLDQVIVTVATPRITSQFNSLTDVGWYGSVYLLTTTAFQPTFGKIYTNFNIKLTVICSLILFEIGSIICATAHSSTTFIVGRAVVGAGAAGVFCGGMTVVGYSVPLAQRAIYIAALYGMFGISSIVAELLGGVFSDKVTWRWCFWINLPFGGLSILLVMFFFREPARNNVRTSFNEKFKELDLAGGFFLIAAVICLILALSWGGVTYPWSDSRVWGNLLGCGLITIVFIYIQFRKGDRATIPIRLLKQRTIVSASLLLLLISIEMYTHLYYLPFYFQVVKDTTATQSGIRCIAYLLSQAIGAMTVGTLVTVLGYYTPFITFGTALCTIGCGLLYTLKVDSGAGAWIGYQVITGFGSGCATQLPFIAVQAVSDERDMPTANAMSIFFYSLGGSLSVSIAQNIFENSLTSNLLKYAPGIPPSLVSLAGSIRLSQIIPPSLLPGVLFSYNAALMASFVLPIVAVGLSFMVSFMFEKKNIKTQQRVIRDAA